MPDRQRSNEIHMVETLNYQCPEEDDCNDPLKWSTLRKVLSTAIVCSIGFVTTLGASMYAPGHRQVEAEFEVSTTVSLLPLSAYSLGLAFGPLVSSPLSETFGRKFVYLLTLPLFDVFMLGCGFSHDIVSLTICRFFAGLFAAPGVSVSAATIVDFTAPESRAPALAAYYTVPFIGSAVGPLIGGFVTEHRGWRWTSWTVLMMVAGLHPPALYLRESYRTILQRQKAMSLVCQTSIVPGQSTMEVLKGFLVSTIVRPLHMLFTEPLVGCVCLYTGFQFALLYTFVVALPLVFESVYGFSVQGQSLAFLGLVTGCLLAPIVLILGDRQVRKRRTVVSNVSNENQLISLPEDRLCVAMFGSLILPAGLFWFAWTARRSVHWLCPITAQALTLLGSILIYVPCNFYMLDIYGAKYGASASGASSLSRYTLSAAFPLFVPQMYEALGVHWATSILATVAVLMAPIPWVFHRYGPVLRVRSSYEHEK